MKRLTDRRMRGEGFIPVDSKEYKAVLREEKPTTKQIYKRLMEIEDILGDDYDLDRLKELVEADREGRCVVLPCKIGEPIWKVLDVCEFPGDCHATQTCKGCEYREVFKEKLALTLYMLSESGKLEPPYYASEKEAESALEKMKEWG